MKGRDPKADLEMLIAECFDQHSGTLPHLDVHDAILQVRALYSLARDGHLLLSDAKHQKDKRATEPSGTGEGEKR